MSTYTGKENAIKLLIHYLRFGLEAKSGKWENDNNIEVEDLVESIIEAAVDKTVKIMISREKAVTNLEKALKEEQS